MEKTLSEKKTLSKGIKSEHLRRKIVKDSETDWQRSVKKKKSEEYYAKLSQVENDQIVKEQRLREHSHQYAIPGERIVNQSLAQGMASAYEQSLWVL